MNTFVSWAPVSLTFDSDVRITRKTALIRKPNTSAIVITFTLKIGF